MGTPKDTLFQLDSPAIGEISGELPLMSFPFFALSKKAWMEPLVYSTRTGSIEVRPSPLGVATIYDKEIILLIASLIASKIEEGASVSQDLILTANDLFSATGSNHSARSYSRLSDALGRLQGTQIKTNIEVAGGGEVGFFSWLSAARLQYAPSSKGEKRLKAVKVRLSDWLFRTILRERQLLDYAPTYRKLGPIQRRIYEVARSACIDGERLEMGVEALKSQIGFRRRLPCFDTVLRKLAAANDFPDYDIRLVEDAPMDDARRHMGSMPAKVRVIFARRPELSAAMVVEHQSAEA